MVSEATYLGFRVGPAATDASKWAEPVAKFSDRVQAMARAGAAPSAALHYYDFVRLVLAYVAQLVLAGPSVAHAYEVAAQRLLHMPHTAMPLRFGRLLGARGLRPMADPADYCFGAMRRTAERLEPEVRECAV